MAEERLEVPASDLMRWLIVLLLVVGGVALYLVLAPETAPVVHAVSQEQAP